ncbi:uncharacterized protein LOC143891098 [Tasmannia lanceolata]|uniref:uncharacterized protein LOC143891098 n=1 Tax=Tasmannia lanceolata TaxID=3420 RepID=UPI004063D6D3
MDKPDTDGALGLTDDIVDEIIIVVEPMLMSDSETSDIEPESPVIAEADVDEHDDSVNSPAPVAEHLKRQLDTSPIETDILAEPREVDLLTESTEHRPETEASGLLDESLLETDDREHIVDDYPIFEPLDQIVDLCADTEEHVMQFDQEVLAFAEIGSAGPDETTKEIIIEKCCRGFLEIDLVEQGLMLPMAITPVQEEYVAIFLAALLVRCGSFLYGSPWMMSSISLRSRSIPLSQSSRAMCNIPTFDGLRLMLLEWVVYVFDSGGRELEGWEMGPFIEAIDAQPFTYFIIRCFCDILRIRWESTRSRTKQRALLMMDKLVQSIYEAFPGATQRIQFSYGVYVPTIPALRKEYGELLVGCGMIGDALKIFEDLVLWDNLIYCYRSDLSDTLLEKKAATVELIKARLYKMPNDPRLWCSLGDVLNNDAYYEKALEVSNKRSSRAKRSLPHSAYNRGDYETSKILWYFILKLDLESAMAINSLYPDGSFALGAAALKAQDIDKALDGFARDVQLDPDNGEAWNNITCLHMINKKSKEAFIAVKEALKYRRSSWQMWENYSQVAMDINNFSQALEATKMVLDMTNNKRIDTPLLERVMVEMEARTSMPTLLPSAALGDHHCWMQASPGDSRETEHLMALLGEVLHLSTFVLRFSVAFAIYEMQLWHKIKGDLTMCSEALLKQVRSYQGSDLWHNQDQFKKFVRASLQLCKLYMETASSTGNRRELTTAEMHLRNTVKQAERFTYPEAFRVERVLRCVIFFKELHM